MYATAPRRGPLPRLLWANLLYFLITEKRAPFDIRSTACCWMARFVLCWLFTYLLTSVTVGSLGWWDWSACDATTNDGRTAECSAVLANVGQTKWTDSRGEVTADLWLDFSHLHFLLLYYAISNFRHEVK